MKLFALLLVLASDAGTLDAGSKPEVYTYEYNTGVMDNCFCTANIGTVKCSCTKARVPWPTDGGWEWR